MLTGSSPQRHCGGPLTECAAVDDSTFHSLPRHGVRSGRTNRAFRGRKPWRPDTASGTDTVGRLGPGPPFHLVWRQRACGGHSRRTWEVAFAARVDEWSRKRHHRRRLLSIMVALPVISMLFSQ